MWQCKKIKSVSGSEYVFYFNDERYITKIQQKSALRECAIKSPQVIDGAFMIKKELCETIGTVVQEIVKQEITKFAEKFGSHISGHSNYHGDNILSALYCLAEGKQIDAIKPL